jgi:hypothetical protein
MEGSEAGGGASAATPVKTKKRKAEDAAKHAAEMTNLFGDSSSDDESEPGRIVPTKAVAEAARPKEAALLTLPKELLALVLPFVGTRPSGLVSVCLVLHLDVHAVASEVVGDATILDHAARCRNLRELQLTNCDEVDLARFPRITTLYVENEYSQIGGEALVIRNGREHPALKDVSLVDVGLVDTGGACLAGLPRRITTLYIDAGEDYVDYSYDGDVQQATYVYYHPAGIHLGNTFPHLEKLTLQGRGEENLVHSPGRTVQKIHIRQCFVEIGPLAVHLAAQGATTRFELPEDFVFTARPCPPGYHRGKCRGVAGNIRGARHIKRVAIVVRLKDPELRKGARGPVGVLFHCRSRVRGVPGMYASSAWETHCDAVDAHDRSLMEASGWAEQRRWLGKPYVRLYLHPPFLPRTMCELVPVGPTHVRLTNGEEMAYTTATEGLLVWVRLMQLGLDRDAICYAEGRV